MYAKRQQRLFNEEGWLMGSTKAPTPWYRYKIHLRNKSLCLPLVQKCWEENVFLICFDTKASIEK